MNQNPLALTTCWLCQASLFMADASNFQGHFAHGSCIAKWNATKAAGTTPESVPPPVPPAEIIPPPDDHSVPRMEETVPLTAFDDLDDRDEPEGIPVSTGNVGPFPFGQPDVVMGVGPEPDFDHGYPGQVMIGMMFPTDLVSDGPNANDILNEIRNVAELLLSKNRAYGSSFAKPMNVFSKLDPVAAINARLDDKLARIKQSKDFTEDTEMDIVGYLILKRIAMRLAREEHERQTQPELPGILAEAMKTEGALISSLLNESLSKPQSISDARISAGVCSHQGDGCGCGDPAKRCDHRYPEGTVHADGQCFQCLQQVPIQQVPAVSSDQSSSTAPPV